MNHTREAVLRTVGLSVGYCDGNSSYLVHSGLDVELKRGEMVCLVGPNGSGKSTLLRTIAGLQDGLGGDVFIQGKRMSELSMLQLSRLRSIVLTTRFEYGYMTVQDLVSIGRFPHLGWLGRLSPSDKRRVAEAIDISGLNMLKHKQLSRLSDGELQRAMIAKALAQESPVIMLDEPTAHLDLPNRVAVMKLLQGLARETSTAIILSTHELDLAMQSADRLWLMSASSGIQCGLPEELALSGCVADVFNSDNVHFDVSNGVFVMHRQRSGRIGLTGSGAGYFWTKRVLERLGFTVTDAQDELLVSPSSSGYLWRLTVAGSVIECRSLSELVGLL